MLFFPDNIATGEKRQRATRFQVWLVHRRLAWVGLSQNAQIHISKRNQLSLTSTAWSLNNNNKSNPDKNNYPPKQHGIIIITVCQLMSQQQTIDSKVLHHLVSDEKTN